MGGLAWTRRRAGAVRYVFVCLSLLAASQGKRLMADDDGPAVASAVTDAERRVAAVRAFLVRPDGQTPALSMEQRRQLVGALLGLRGELESGKDASRARAFSSIATAGYVLSQLAREEDALPVFEALRPLASVTKCAVQGGPTEVAAAAVDAYPWVACSSDVARDLGAVLDDARPELGKHALLVLRKLGTLAWRHVPKILSLAGPEHGDLGDLPGQVLEELAPPPSLLAQALDDAEPAVRLAALRGCSRAECRSLAAKISTLLVDPNESTRRQACVALGAMAASEHASLLVARLSDGDAPTRWAAAAALGSMRPAAARVAPALAKAVESGERQLVAESLRSLERIGEPASAALPAVLKLLEQPAGAHRGDAARAANQLSLEVHERFILALADPATPVEQARLAASGLGSRGDARGVQALLSALQHPDAAVQGAAATSLGWIGPAAADALATLQVVVVDASRSDSVRFDARTAIGRIKRP